jgi:hypothetical protein
MFSAIQRRITYANVVATLALVFAMGGSALAAKHYLVNSTKQINPKVLKKLKGSNGKNGATGPAGPAGAAGVAGTPGAKGERGPGIVASGQGESSCELASSTNYCYATAPFTPSANATCEVSVNAQIEASFATSGPFLRVAYKAGGTNHEDELNGLFFEGTTGGESTTQEHTALIPVTAGTTYEFGAEFGFTAGSWLHQTAEFTDAYVCYGS